MLRPIEFECFEHLNSSYWLPFSGVDTFDIDIDAQKVTVKGNVERDVVFQTVSKTGKKTAYWEDDASAAPAATPAPAEAEAKPAEPLAAA